MNFRFPLQVHLLGERTMIYGVLRRFYARRTANILIKHGCPFYQFGGYNGTLKKAYSLVNADVYQLIHWILFTVGYDCTPADVMKRCGVNPETKPAPEGTLELDREEPVCVVSKKNLTEWIARVRVPWLDYEKLK